MVFCQGCLFKFLDKYMGKIFSILVFYQGKYLINLESV